MKSRLHVDDGTWTHRHPAGLVLPDQGWKIHLTTTGEYVAELVTTASRYCHAHQLAFKHLSDQRTVTAQLSKNADRATAAKIVTIYPLDEHSLHQALIDLDAALSHLPAPWILSDLRWNRGPAFVRYGAFTSARLLSSSGRKKHGLRAPDGQLIEDRREAYFAPPSWVALPDFLQEQWDSLGDGATPGGFPYTVQSALAFSNAGGTYLAHDAQGAAVVLKEGRPRIGFTADGRDGAQRIRDEHARLIAAANPRLVAARELVQVNDHVFLALEYLDGTTLNREIVLRSPTIRAGADRRAIETHRLWANDISTQLRSAISSLHAAGVTHGDLHPGNVMITRDNRVVLVDLEFSKPVTDSSPADAGAPGFVAPDGRVGIDADLYALACIELAFFCPLTPLLALAPEKADELVHYAQSAYGLPDDWAQSVADVLRSRTGFTPAPSQLGLAADATLQAWDTDSEAGISQIAVMLGRSLDAAVDFSRGDRLWPGDPAQFDESGVSLAHGAAGVIHAMREAALDVDPLAISWFRQSTEAALASRTPDLGLYDGLAGAAWVHRRCGEDSLATAIVNRLRETAHEHIGNDLYAGLAGIGLLYLSELDQDPGLLADAARIADTLRTRRESHPTSQTPTAVTSRGAGLMWGATGTALFALRLFEQTGSREHLQLAMDALDEDLLHCRTADDGSLQVDEGRRLLPYLAAGSAGIGIVLAQLIPHLSEPERYSTQLDGIARAASAPFTVQAGLFAGRSGLMLLQLTLARLGRSTPELRASLDEHAKSLRLHAVRHAAGVGFVGDGLLRLSCDLATGSAGALLTLDAYGLLAYAPAYPPQEILPLLLPHTSAASPMATDKVAPERR